jgi:hypothetical protein
MVLQVTTSWDGILLNTLQPFQCSHISHTCRPSYCTQRHHTHNHFEWAVDEQASHLGVLLNRHTP